MVGHGVSQGVLPASHAVARSFLATLAAFHRLLVGQAELLHPRHVHLELALVAEEVLAVARGPIALIGATACRLRSMVLVGGGRPFLARLSN